MLLITVHLICLFCEFLQLLLGQHPPGEFWRFPFPLHTHYIDCVWFVQGNVSIIESLHRADNWNCFWMLFRLGTPSHYLALQVRCRMSCDMSPPCVLSGSCFDIGLILFGSSPIVCWGRRKTLSYRGLHSSTIVSIFVVPNTLTIKTFRSTTARHFPVCNKKSILTLCHVYWRSGTLILKSCDPHVWQVDFIRKLNIDHLIGNKEYLLSTSRAFCKITLDWFVEVRTGSYQPGCLIPNEAAREKALCWASLLIHV